MAGRFGRLALDRVTEDLIGTSNSRSARSRLTPDVDLTIQKAAQSVDMLVKELRVLVKAYTNTNSDTEEGKASLKKLEKLFDKVDRVRNIYGAVY